MIKMTFIKETIKEMKFDLAFEMENATETSSNAMAIATCKRRLETAEDAQYLLEIGEISLGEAEAMVADASMIM